MIIIAVPAEFTICEGIMFLLLICVLACLKNEAVDRVLPAALIFIFLIIDFGFLECYGRGAVDKMDIV